jgi:hypothetical protein
MKFAMLILMAAFLSTLGRLFGREPGKSPYKTAGIYQDLRNQAPELKAEQSNAPTNQPVQAVLMNVEGVDERKVKIELPTREIYVKEPGIIFEGNPKNYLTEILLPLQG